MTPMTNKKNLVILSVLVVIIGIAIGVAYLFKGAPKPVARRDVGGAIGNQLAEQYDPYIQYNGGFYTNLPIKSGSTFESVGAATLDSTLTVTGASTLTGAVTFNGSATLANSLSTTTPASMTMAQNDLTFSTVLVTPTNGAVTMTLPATSTLTSFISSTGNYAQVDMCNASTTPGANITIAAGTGMNFTVASSSASSVVLNPKKCGTLEFVKMANTDVDVLVKTGL